MGKSSEACLRSANDDGNITKCRTCHIRINNSAPVGSAAAFSAGGVNIARATFFSSSVVINHRINNSARNQNAESWFCIARKGVFIVPVGLGANAHTKTVMFKKTGKNCHAERWVVNIGISRYK